MKHLFKKSAFAVVLAAAPNALAQDVYNFYFQKAQDAKEMVQVKSGDPLAAPTISKTGDATGGKDATAATAPELAPVKNEIVATLSAQTEKDHTRNYWRFGFGVGSFTDHGRMIERGTGARIEYGYSKYFAVEGQLISGRDPLLGDKTFYAGAGGLRITPIHVEFFGWDLIEVSALAGAMSTTGSEAGTTSEFRIAPYVGIGGAINFTNRFAILFDGKFEEGNSKFGQATTQAVYRF